MIIRTLLAWTLIAVIPLTAADAPPKTKTKTKDNEPARPIAHMVLEQKMHHQEDFSKGLPEKMWNSPTGTWTVVDGALNGVERAQDKHSGIFGLTVAELTPACVIRFRFRLGEMNRAEVMGLGRIDGRPRATYILNIDPGGFQLGSMADKTDPADKGTRWFGPVAQTFDRQTWYQMTLELNGDEALAYTDDEHVSLVRDPVFLKPRSGISLRAHGVGKSGSYDDVMLTTGVVAPGWEMLRPQFEELSEKLKVKPKGKK